MELREAHREKGERNEVRVDTLWARPCREVDELVVSRELVYPSLEAEVLARPPLASQ